MSTCPPNNPSTDTCIGTIQVSSQFGIPGLQADVVLGISFLRNIYTVHNLDTPTSGRGTHTPRLAIAPLTNPVLALTEFENVRVLGLTPSGGGRTSPQTTDPPSESMIILSKIAIGIGGFLLAAVLLFVALCIALRRRYHARRRAGIASHNVSEIGHGGGEVALSGEGIVDGAAEFAEVIQQETALRAKKKKKKQGLGGWRPPSTEWHENVDGIEGDVATRSAAGHGSIRRGEPSEQVDHVMASWDSMGGQGVDDRSAERRGSGPVTGLSLRALVGALRVFRGTRSAEVKGGELYELSDNPVLHIHAGGDLDGEGEGEGGLTLADTGRAGRENASNVWSKATGAGPSHGTLVPTGTMVDPVNLQYPEFGERKAHTYPGTPDETVVGGTTRFVGSQNNEYRSPKDTASERGSTIYGSHGLGKGGGAGTALHSKSSSASNIPLMGAPPDRGMASTSSLGSPAFVLGQAPRPTSRGQGVGYANHRSLPSLELNLPHRRGSSGILTASPVPLSRTLSEGAIPFEPLGTPPQMIPSTPPSSTPPPLSATPPRIAPTPPRVPSSPTSYEGFNPLDVPASIHSPPPAPVHPPKARMIVAIEPNLSPLTEVNSSEFPSSTPNRVSIMSALTATVDQNAADAARMEPDRSGLERQNSVGAQRMESEVLVPLPISGMNLSSRWEIPPPPMEHLRTPVERRCGAPPAQHRASEIRPSPVTVPLCLPPAQKMDASRSLPVQESSPLTQSATTFSMLPPKPSLNTFYPRIVPAAVPPPARPPPAPNMSLPNTSYDMLALNGRSLGSISKDARFRSRENSTHSAKDPPFPSITPAPSSNVPNNRPGQPEQHTIPIVDLTREGPRPAPLSRVSEPTNSSLGMKGPRPMVAGPRSPNSAGSLSNPGSTYSVPNFPPSAGNQSAGFQSRYQTT